jgi:hypothetical protein
MGAVVVCVPLLVGIKVQSYLWGSSRRHNDLSDDDGTSDGCFCEIDRVIDDGAGARRAGKGDIVKLSYILYIGRPINREIYHVFHVGQS